LLEDEAVLAEEGNIESDVTEVEIHEKPLEATEQHVEVEAEDLCVLQYELELIDW
jgi:hypothetical protein